MNMHVPSPAPERRPIAVRLATPRGFCAGVDRAIQIVERALEKYGAPVFVRHEIVHNRHVVERLKALGVGITIAGVRYGAIEAALDSASASNASASRR